MSSSRTSKDTRIINDLKTKSSNNMNDWGFFCFVFFFLLQISIIFSNFKLYENNSHYNLKMKISCCKMNLNEQIIILISFAIFDKKKNYHVICAYVN